MAKQKFEDQDVMDRSAFDDGDGCPSCESESCANMADEDRQASATMTEDDEPAAESETTDGSEIESTEACVAEWRDKYLRLQAEFDNYRKRTLREKMDLVASGGADVLKCMLSVLDDVHRAVAASEKSDDIASLREGERLVAQKFEDALRQKGVSEIEACGKEFDPDFHEAVARFAAGEDKKGVVIDVVQRGYMLGDKVLRYAKVVVGE